MKQFTLTLCCLLWCVITSNGANITINFTDANTKPIRILKPVQGTYFPGNVKVYTRNKNNQLIVENDLTKAGIVQLYYGKLYSFYIDPGKNYIIDFKSKTDQPDFAFTGDNAAGQYLLNQSDHSNYQGKAARYQAKDTTIQSIQSAIDKDLNNDQKQFKRLWQQKQISNDFYDYSLLEIKYYYAAVLSIIIADHRDHPSFADVWPSLFGADRLTNISASTTTSFHDYAEQYSTWYRSSYHRAKAGITKKLDMRKSNEYLTFWYHSYADDLTGTPREYMLSRFLYQFMTMKKFEQELVDLFNEFKKDYPQSIYLPYLQPEATEIVAYQTKAKQALTPEMQIVKDYHSINSLTELLEKYKDKTLYVDIWATWCAPCKEEFAFAKDLKAFLKDKNAQVLYISTDLDERDKEWQQMVKVYELTGLNLRTSDKLRQDLIDRIWKTKSYAIPRYLIIKNGAVVENHALRPSDKEKLYDQISRYL